MSCPRCGGREWICEAHPDQPFEHEVDGKVCPGPGDPCPECNDLSPAHSIRKKWLAWDELRKGKYPDGNAPHLERWDLVLTLARAERRLH